MASKPIRTALLWNLNIFLHQPHVREQSQRVHVGNSICIGHRAAYMKPGQSHCGYAASVAATAAAATTTLGWPRRAALEAGILPRDPSGHYHIGCVLGPFRGGLRDIQGNMRAI